MDTTVIYKSFTELSTEELYKILRLRSEVFIVEQNCVYLDVDGKDQRAIHAMIMDGGRLVAYLRYYAGDTSPVMQFGRVIVDPDYRGKKLGDVLIRDVIKVIQKTGAQQIAIEAQAQLEKFYGDFGFVSCSELYEMDGLPHMDMVLTL